MNLKKYDAITVVDTDLVLPVNNRELLIHLVADYSRTDPAKLDIDQALDLLGLRGVDYTLALTDTAGTTTTNTDTNATTALTDLMLLPNNAPAHPWISRIIEEHPDIFLTNDDIRAGEPYITNQPSQVHVTAALHSSQIRDEVDLTGSVPFIVYRENATGYETIVLVRVDAVHTHGDTHLTVERTVIIETCDPETWYYPILAENGD